MNDKEAMMVNRKWLFFVSCWLFLSLSGCATITETGKGFLGVSTKVLEEKRKEAIARTLKCDYNTAYNKTKDILKHIGAYIYAERFKKEKMIAVYVSEADTTPVGIFFQEIDATNTQIEVSSPSKYAKEFISKRIFSGLEKELKASKEQGQTDEKKEMDNK